MDDQTIVVPFSNGTEAGVWHERNCEQCARYEMESESEEEAKCKMAFHIDLGFMAGEIPMWVAKRIGCITHGDSKYIKLSNCGAKV